jgi:hypothetical protein
MGVDGATLEEIGAALAGGAGAGLSMIGTGLLPA